MQRLAVLTFCLVFLGKAEPKDLRVEEFVATVHSQGTPYVEREWFEDGAQAKLLSILKTAGADKKRWLPNVVLTLGYIGDETVIPTLIEFAKSPPSANIDVRKAQECVPFALGCIVARTGNRKALQFLTELLRAYMQGSQTEDILMTRVVIVALGMTGQKKAAAELDKLKSSPQFQELAAEMIQNNQRVREKGLRAYYGLP